MTGSAGETPALRPAARLALLRRAAVKTNTLLARLHECYIRTTRQRLAIRLSQSIEKRLEKLARRTGRTKTFYVREAILQHLEDLEEIYAAERVLERIRNGRERTIPLEDVLKNQ